MRKIGIAVRVLLVIVLVGLGLPAGVQAQGGDDGLVAEWHFDEGSGSVLVDSSGNGNDGVIHGATWVEGKYGGALSFDGRDDYVDCGNDESLDITDGDFTFEAWFKSSTDVNNYQFILKKGNSHIHNENFKFVSFSISRNGLPEPSPSRLFMHISDGDGVNEYCAKSTDKIIDGEWHHGAAVVDLSNYKMCLYVDGVQNDEVSIDGFDGFSVSNNVFIGYTEGRQDMYFNGIIDEVRIYNRALTADEIKEHYEGEQTALSLTKSASPHSIKQGQTTTVTLTVKNTGTTEITDIEVSDTIPSDLIFVSGETSKTYASLRPKDSREFQYSLQLNDAGTFNLDPATATYADEEGNYHTAGSKTATITVIPSTDQPPTPHATKNPSTEISTASVHLHGEKTDVVLGEEVLLKLSAVNIIGNPLMRVQVIIIPPSGWSVTSSAFAKTGAGQYTTIYDIEEGVGRDIEVRIMPNQIGDDFQVQGRIIYYFGDDSDAREDHTLTLPITVRAEAENGQGAERTADTSRSEEKASSTPGFAAVVAVIGLFTAHLWRKRV